MGQDPETPAALSGPAVHILSDLVRSVQSRPIRPGAWSVWGQPLRCAVGSAPSLRAAGPSPP